MPRHAPCIAACTDKVLFACVTDGYWRFDMLINHHRPVSGVLCVNNRCQEIHPDAKTSKRVPLHHVKHFVDLDARKEKPIPPVSSLTSLKVTSSSVSPGLMTPAGSCNASTWCEGAWACQNMSRPKVKACSPGQVPMA